MILDATERGLSHRLCLFYGNRRPEEAAFLSELAQLEKRNPRFKLIATCTEASDDLADWSGERGYITRETISKHVGDITTPIYYVAGPAARVFAMQTLLAEAGVKARTSKRRRFWVADFGNAKLTFRKPRLRAAPQRQADKSRCASA